MQALKLVGLLGAFVALGVYHFAIYAPQPDRPHALAVLDRAFNVLLAAAITTSATLLGLRILNALGRRFARAEAIGLAGGIGLLSLSLLTLPLGFMALYYPPVFAVLVATPLLCCGTERRMLSKALRRLGNRAMRVRVRREHLSYDHIARMSAATLCGVTLAFTFARDLTMPSLSTGYDTYQYHWAIPALLLQAHKQLAFPGWAHANLPFGTEMLSLIALAFEAPYAALLIADSFLLLAAIVLFCLVRRHFSTTAAWFAVATLTSVPLLIVFSSQAMVEPALVYFGLAILATLVAWLSKALDHGRLDWRLAAVVGLLSGAAIAVKLMGIYYLPAVVAVFAIGIAVAVFGGAQRAQRGLALRQATATVAAFALGTAAMYGPWALKDWLLLGNPVYPALRGLFGASLWNGARDLALASTFASFGPKMGNTARWHLYALDLFLHPWRYGEGQTFAAGLMAFFVFALGFAFVWLAVRRTWLRRPGNARARVLVMLVAALLMLSTGLLWTFSGALVERYALPFVMLANIAGALLLAWGAERAARPLRPARWVALLLLLGICGFQASVSLFDPAYSDSPDRSPVAILLGQQSETAQLRGRAQGNQPPEFWQMTDYVNHALPRSGRLLMLGRGTGYFIEQRDYVADSGGDWVPYLVSTGKSPEGMLREIQRLGFRYVVYDGGLMLWLTEIYRNQELARDLPAYLAFQRSQLIPLASWGRISVYAVPDVTVDAADARAAAADRGRHIMS